MQAINVTKPFLPPIEEFQKYIARIWDSQWLTNNGPLQQEFSQKLCEHLGIPHIELTTNGHMALELALREGARVSGEVITTPFTFASTPHAIYRVGASPVFADIKSSDMTIDPESIKKCITEKTSAIVPVHVYGHPCDTEAIQKIADEYHLEVIYDAAHAFGEKINNKSLLSEGSFSIISFHATKLFHSCEGGGVVCNNKEAIARLRQGRNFGILDEETVVSPGGNAKMNELQAAMGLSVLPHIDDIIAKRKQITFLYRDLLRNTEGLSLFCVDKTPSFTYNYAYLPLIIKPQFPLSRDEVYYALQESGINTRRYFWPLASNFFCYGSCRKDTLHNAEVIANSILCLPIYYDLDFNDVHRICSLLHTLSQ